MIPANLLIPEVTVRRFSNVIACVLSNTTISTLASSITLEKFSSVTRATTLLVSELEQHVQEKNLQKYSGAPH